MVKTILFLAANPRNSDQLRLDEEVREIQAGLERARRRDEFVIISRWAVRVGDLQRALHDRNPQIVHFSGHGAGNHGLVLENETGQAQLVGAEALAGLFRLFSSVKCVLLNVCDSGVQATAIHQHVDYVIGMKQNIGDRAAIDFSVGFYDALGAGRSYEDAFRFGCNAIALQGIPESQTPILFSRDRSPSTPEQPVEPLPVPARKGDLKMSEWLGGMGKPLIIRGPDRDLLLMQVMNKIENVGNRIAYLNFQAMVDNELDSRGFYQLFCRELTRDLRIRDDLDAHWNNKLSNKSNCLRYIGDYILTSLNTSLVLAIMEVDLIFDREFRSDFFSMLRSCFSSRPVEVWSKFNLVFVTERRSEELIERRDGSPFNIAIEVDSRDCTLE